MEQIDPQPGLRRGKHGQAMVEFALIVPFVFFLIFGVMDGSLLVFSVVSTQFAAAQGDKAAAQAGNAKSPEDADQLALDAVRRVVGPTTIIKVIKVEIFELNRDVVTGALSPNLNHLNSYNLDGTFWNGTIQHWDPVTRSVTNGNSSYIGLKLYYSYTLHATFLPNALPSVFSATSDGRIEPQTY